MLKFLKLKIKSIFTFQEDGNTGGGASLWGGSANADKGSTKQVEERGSFKMEWTNNSNVSK